MTQMAEILFGGCRKYSIGWQHSQGERPGWFLLRSGEGVLGLPSGGTAACLL